MIFSNKDIGSKIKVGDYHPFATVDDRDVWANLPENINNLMIEEGEKYLKYNWPQLYATDYLEFTRIGNQSNFNSISFNRRHVLGSLVIAECIEGKGRFLDDIVNGIWLICEESSWIISAHNAEPDDYNDPKHIGLPDLSRKPLLCLFSLETSALLAWTSYLLKSKLDSISPIICERISREVKWRTLDAYLEREDYWWMGFRKDEGITLNNWVPWTTSNILTAFLFLEKDEDRLNKAINKCMFSLDQFMEIYPKDGGCDEGPGYWTQAGASLLDCIEIIHEALKNSINLFQEPIIAEIGRYIYRVNIKGEKYTNFADCSAKVNIPCELVYRYGKHIGDTKLMSLGAKAVQISPDNIVFPQWFPIFRVLNTMFNYNEVLNYDTQTTFVKDVWFEGIQMMIAREREGSYKGLFLAAKGGNNDESHNHNDIGQFIVYYNGEPAIIDVGVGTYTAKTFSLNRYDIWSMQSAYHNLPTVNNIMQMEGNKYRADNVKYSNDGSVVTLDMDISGAYPDAAQIVRWDRLFMMDRCGSPFIEITDDFELEDEGEAGEIKLSLMTQKEPGIDGQGRVVLSLADDSIVNIDYECDKLIASYERITLDDPALVQTWGECLYRITLKSSTPVKQDRWSLKIWGQS